MVVVELTCLQSKKEFSNEFVSVLIKMILHIFSSGYIVTTSVTKSQQTLSIDLTQITISLINLLSNLAFTSYNNELISIITKINRKNQFHNNPEVYQTLI
jgi:hypothetical protein